MVGCQFDREEGFGSLFAEGYGFADDNVLAETVLFFEISCLVKMMNLVIGDKIDNRTTRDNGFIRRKDPA